MKARWLVVGIVLVACGGAESDGEMGAEADAGEGMRQEQTAMAGACEPQADLADRPSPYDSTTVELDGAVAKICYGRPSLRGRTMIGGEAVPFDTIWRTGANEPTTIHLPVAAEIAGTRLEPGSYTIYTVPREGEEWTVVLNGSTSQWGHESRYTGAVREAEISRSPVRAETTDGTIEQLTIRSEPTADGADIVVEWQNTRVYIPIRPATG